MFIFLNFLSLQVENQGHWLFCLYFVDSGEIVNGFFAFPEAVRGIMACVKRLKLARTFLFCFVKKHHCDIVSCVKTEISYELVLGTFFSFLPFLSRNTTFSHGKKVEPTFLIPQWFLYPTFVLCPTSVRSFLVRAVQKAGPMHFLFFLSNQYAFTPRN